MPQYNTPTLVTEMLAADTVLFWKASAAGVRTIIFSDLVDSVNSLLSKVDDVNIIVGNTTLDDTYQFVVCNSGGTFTITLPDTVANPGLRFKIGNKGAGTVTVQRTGSDTIAAAGSSSTSVTITQYNTYDFESDGAGVWFRS